MKTLIKAWAVVINPTFSIPTFFSKIGVITKGKIKFAL